jgi:hypothetical protein
MAIAESMARFLIAPATNRTLKPKGFGSASAMIPIAAAAHTAAHGANRFICLTVVSFTTKPPNILIMPELAFAKPKWKWLHFEQARKLESKPSPL